MNLLLRRATGLEIYTGESTAYGQKVEPWNLMRLTGKSVCNKEKRAENESSPQRHQHLRNRQKKQASKKNLSERGQQGKVENEPKEGKGVWCHRSQGKKDSGREEQKNDVQCYSNKD